MLVIGGGPAGSTAAALLAEHGRRVVVIEKARHPRFHIGESLLPLNQPLFERLGVLDRVAKLGMVKHGAEFIRPSDNRTVTYDFSDALDKAWTSAFQVRRSEFDHMLLENASAKGAAVYQESRVSDVRFDADGADVDVTAADGSQGFWRARYVLDGSGRDAFLATRMVRKRRNTRHASAAIYGHFANARRLAGRAEGNISIFWFAHGWFWFIPLKDGATSVGAVCWPAYLKSRRVPPSQFLMETIALCPLLAERLAGASLLEPASATGNYSYSAERMYGQRYVLIGDAFAFVDPVFSSGVHLAMKSAALAADAVDAALCDPAAAPSQFAEVDRRVRLGLGTFEWLIYRMTSPAIQHLFMYPSQRWQLQAAITSLLAGDVYGNPEIVRRLWLFRAIYYLLCLRFLPRTIVQWSRRVAARRESFLFDEARG